MKETLTVNLEVEPSQNRSGKYSCNTKLGGDDSPKEKRKIQMEGPDGIWAWCVALAACSITFIIAGLARISGIMYVAYIDVFQVSRGEAAYPSSIRNSTKNLLGPIVGILGQQYGIRAVTLAGAVIASFSAAVCFFATSIDFIVIVWGGINGIGCALAVTLIQVVIGQHFKKHTSTASGLSFSGGCVGSFVFPVLIEYLLHNFGLQGTFLIISAIIMHIIPAALILRKPAWLKKQVPKPPSDPDKEEKLEDNSDATVLDHPETTEQFLDDDVSGKTISLDSGIVTETAQKERVDNPDLYYWYHYDKFLVVETVSNVFRSDEELNNIADGINKFGKQGQTENDSLSSWVIELVDDLYETAQSFKSNSKAVARDIPDAGHHSIHSIKYKARQQLVNKMCNFPNENVESLVKELQTTRELTESHAREIVTEIIEVCKLNNQLTINPDSVRVDIDPDSKDRKKKLLLASLQNFVPKKIKLPMIKKDGFREHLKTALKLNYNPIFILVCLCRVVHILTFVPFLTVLVDYGIDKGLHEDDGKYIIAALSAGDLLGRVGLGWVTDRNVLGLPRFMMCAMVTQGVLTVTLPLVHERYLFMFTVSLFGMFVGAVFIRHPVLISKYLRRKEQSIAMGCINFVPGVLGLGLPAFIGYFRDNLGSYDKMFFITGSVAICIGLLWILEPQLAKIAPSNADETDDTGGEAVISAE